MEALGTRSGISHRWGSVLCRRPLDSQLCTMCLAVLFAVLFAVLVSVAGSPMPDDSKPASVVVFYRHGDRTPVDPYPLDPWRDPKYWPVPFGELTDTGKRQHFELGKTLRSRYEHLIPDKFEPTHVHIQSTDTDRTLMSALSNLAGMFPLNQSKIIIPGLQWQPIPVHTIPEFMDETLSMKAACPKFNMEMDNLLNSIYFKKLLEELDPVFRYLTNNTGKVINNLQDASYIYDVLKIEEIYNYTLPEWTKSVYPDKLKLITEISFLLDTYNPTLAKLKIGPLLKEIAEHITLVLTEKDFYKMKIYSCHDTTLASILNGLGLMTNVLPPYASSLIFEIYQESTRFPPHIKILYQMKELDIPNCQKMCPVSQWISNISHLIPSNHTLDCSLGIKTAPTESIVYLSVIVCLIILLIITIIVLKCKMSRKYICEDTGTYISKH